MQSDSSKKGNAQWTPEMENIFLSELTKHSVNGKRGDGGFKKKQWNAIASVLREKCQVQLNPDQLRSHLRVWKRRMRALSELYHASGIEWKEEHRTFFALPNWWSDYILDHKDAHYWQMREVTPLHEQVAAWMGVEYGREDDVFEGEPQEFNNLPIINIENLNPVVMNNEEMDESIPHMRPNPTQNGVDTSNSLHSLDESVRDRKKKKVAMRDSNFHIQRELVAAVKALIHKLPKDDLAIAVHINAAVRQLEGFDGLTKRKMMLYFSKHRDYGTCFVAMTEEERMDYAQELQLSLNQ